ncbi:MAG: uroporphyrinogen decarboxylase family protein [Lachnospiraceae bacterium]|nr:uroporphyrinogen decarboxylase family protein [Candidatus Darwinimomas equi]
MNSFERVMNRFEGREVDRLPNFSIVMMFAAKQTGISYGEFLTDYKKLSEAVLYCHEKFGIDVLSAISDSMREVEGFGGKVRIYEDKSPEAEEYVIRNESDISALKLFDPYSSRRTYDRIQAVGLMKQKACGEVPVMGWIEGAFAESCDLMRMEDLFVSLLDDPEPIVELLEKCTEEEILFAKAQIDAGADIIGLGDAATSLIGPSLYERFALPYQQRIIDAIHEKGAKVKLHICGNISSVTDLAYRSGADMIDLDYMVDMEKAAEIIPRNICICGNFNPVSVVLNGTPEQVKEEVRRCRRLSIVNNNCIAPGCEIPPDTRVENVLAIQEAIEEN